jgi:hypothetical protein
MSGTAALSSAKNRRSGNEVKINGQAKSLPPAPPQNTRQMPQAQQQQRPGQQAQAQQQQRPGQQGQQAQAQAPGQLQQRPPTPMDILKSHEIRLRKIEGFEIDQEFSAHMEDYLVFKTTSKDLEQKVSTNHTKSDIKFASMERRIQELTQLIQTLSQSLSDLQVSITKQLLSVQQVSVSQVSVSQASVSQASVSQASVSQASVPQASVSQASVPQESFEEQISSSQNISLEISPL